MPMGERRQDEGKFQPFHPIFMRVSRAGDDPSRPDGLLVIRTCARARAYGIYDPCPAYPTRRN